jgi:hypothetical protein
MFCFCPFKVFQIIEAGIPRRHIKKSPDIHNGIKISMQPEKGGQRSYRNIFRLFRIVNKPVGKHIHQIVIPLKKLIESCFPAMAKILQ